MAAAAAAWWQCGVRGRMTITSIKILRDRVLYRIKRLQGQQCDGDGNGGGGSLTVAAAAEAWQQ